MFFFFAANERNEQIQFILSLHCLLPAETEAKRLDVQRVGGISAAESLAKADGIAEDKN